MSKLNPRPKAKSKPKAKTATKKTEDVAAAAPDVGAGNLVWLFVFFSQGSDVWKHQRTTCI